MDLVLENTLEMNGNDKNDIGMVVIRGNSVVMTNQKEKTLRLCDWLRLTRKTKAENFTNASEKEPINKCFKAAENGYDPFSRRCKKSINQFVSNPFTEASKNCHFAARSLESYEGNGAAGTTNVNVKYCFGNDTLPDVFSVNKGDLLSYQPYAMGRMKYILGEDAMNIIQRVDVLDSSWFDSDERLHPSYDLARGTVGKTDSQTRQSTSRGSGCKKKMKEFPSQVWRLQAALGEQAEITKYSQQAYERLQTVARGTRLGSQTPKLSNPHHRVLLHLAYTDKTSWMKLECMQSRGANIRYYVVRDFEVLFRFGRMDRSIEVQGMMDSLKVKADRSFEWDTILLALWFNR
ncbi:hypothetical protein IFM89_008305 [Coptis chinensis]|uniref:Uncharacterized protein n=1 Tax=Coptis chinensis TaxID=261450 RepID=A0A835IBF0_9MAGN|nr:hypothetical protein IFM89_008305 [Coptis chinensis]